MADAVVMLVDGRVQGVGFRAWAVEEARKLALDGWARNLTDGTVEVVAAGAPEALEAFARRLSEGPKAARVSSVRRSAATVEVSTGSGFAIRR